MTTFGTHLKQARNNKGFSQGQLAEIVEMHSTHISRYERNLANPTIEVVKKIAEALDTSVDYLIYGEEKEKAKSRIEDNELLSIFSKVQRLNKEDTNVIKSLINAYLLKANLQQQLAS